MSGLSVVRLSLAVAALVLSSGLGGCGRPMGSTTPSVTPLPSRGVSALDADDIVRIMVRAGFTDAQTLAIGPAVRNALSTTGAARIEIDQTTEALMATIDGYIHVSSRRRGSFIYDVKLRCCR